MAIDVSQFDSIEELDKFYKKRINQAAEDDEAEVKEEYLTASAAYWKNQAGRASLDAAKLKAIEQFPLAKGFEDLVTGSSPEEILNSAKRVHERFETMQKDEAKQRETATAQEEAEKQAAREAYGSPAGGGGGAVPQPPQQGGFQELESRIHKKLTDGDGMQDSKGKLEFSRWSGERFRQAVDAAQNRPSFKRPNASDKRIQDDKIR